MSTNKLDAFQLFSLIVLFEFGTAILLGVGKDAGRDAWIAMLIGIVGGLILFFLYYALYRYHPDQSIIQYSQTVMGKFFGVIIGLLYVAYFLYMAARNLRDFSDLLIASTYREASLLTISIPVVVCAMFAIYQGIRVLGRMAGICFIFVLLFMLLLFFCKVMSKIIELHNLLPVLNQGWEPVLHQVFPTIITFPFGEIVAFTMFFPYFSHRKSLKTVGFLAVLFSGVYLSFYLALHVAILGESIFIRSTFPFLTAASLINIVDFITRLEILVIIILVILGFFKMLIFFYCGVLGLAEIFNVKQHAKFSIPTGIVILVSSILVASNYTEHIYLGFHVVPYFLHLPFQIIIPFVLLLITLIKRRFRFSFSKV